MTLLESPISTLDGIPTTFGQLAAGRVSLVVNVASQCSLTPQYATLETLHERYADRGFTVIGIPCNQFDAQEPGTAAEIAEFCSTTYGVTFPMTEKVNVNQPDQHPVYSAMTTVKDDRGVAGEVEWNFEKFLLDRQGNVISRIRPDTSPDDPAVIAAIEALLANEQI
ncbi:MAG TPA: glutathione peroxidase [Actinomycetes bacterium]|nr:glutathione peroxidase [Actinomycetes bacterium]